MRRLRTASSPRLLAIVAVLVAVVAGAGIAQAALNERAQARSQGRSTARSSTPSTLRPSTASPRASSSPTTSSPPARCPRDTASPTLTGADRAPVARQRRPAAARAAVGQRRRADRLRRQALPVLRRGVEDAPSPARSPRARHASAERKPATLAGVRQGLAKLGELWTLSGAHADHDRRPPELHRADRARRTTAACSARPSWPGTPPAACRCAPRSTPRARRTRCSSSRRPTSPTARSRPRRSTPRRPRARR